MNIIKGNDFSIKESVVCLGKFDGVHVGHRHLITVMQEQSRQMGLPGVVFTFSVHPGNLFGQGNGKFLSTEDEKEAVLREMGVDMVIAYPFTAKTADMEPEDFVRDVLVGQCHARVIVAGEDFRFGKGRRGDTGLLQELSDVYGYHVKIVSKIKREGEIVSSTRIRTCISQGNLPMAERLLGRNYCISGEVVQGNQMGRTMDMPTANILPGEDKLLPPYGVYASRVLLDDTWYDGITNVGEKPTIEGSRAVGVETHIFAELPMFYQHFLYVYLIEYIREEQKFLSLEALKEQMGQDAKRAKEILQG